MIIYLMQRNIDFNSKTFQKCYYIYLPLVEFAYAFFVVSLLTSCTY